MQATVNPSRTQGQSATTLRRSQQFAAVSNRIIHHSQAPLKEKGFLCVLATWANEDGILYPSDEKIAAKADISVRTVQRLKAKCKKLHELDVLVNASPLKTDLLKICCVGGQTLKQFLANHRAPRATVLDTAADKPKPKLSPEGKEDSFCKSSPVPDSVSLLQDSNKQGVKERISNPKQAAPEQVTAVSPPVVQVLKTGTVEDCERWLTILMDIVTPEALRRKIPLNKAQRRALLNRMNCNVLPWPRTDTPSGRFLTEQLRRPL